MAHLSIPLVNAIFECRLYLMVISFHLPFTRLYHSTSPWTQTFSFHDPHHNFRAAVYCVRLFVFTKLNANSAS